MFLWCVQEVAELKEEDIISHTATATQLPTATATHRGALRQFENDHTAVLSLMAAYFCIQYYVIQGGVPI